jgi:uroporphyrinogen-III synthase
MAKAVRSTVKAPAKAKSKTTVKSVVKAKGAVITKTTAKATVSVKPTVKKKTDTSSKVVDVPKSSASQVTKIGNILITQPRPETEKSPYFEMAKKFNLELTFHPFIKVEGVNSRDFRKQKIDINEHSAIVLTSRNAVDHFFRICDEMKVKVSQEMKYFCITEAVALYLQKFILYRKRKVFFSADGSTEGLLEVAWKHRNNERFIIPTTESGKNDLRDFFTKHNSNFSEATFFRTVSNDIKSVMKKKYDMIVFFSPFSVQTLFENSPRYKQNETVIGTFGPSTTKVAEEAGLILSVKAPAPNAPSMVAAIELFLSRKKK